MIISYQSPWDLILEKTLLNQKTAEKLTSPSSRVAERSQGDWIESRDEFIW